MEGKLSSKETRPVTSIYQKENDDFVDVLETGGIYTQGVNKTPLDYFSTPNLSDEEIKKGICNYLEIESIENNLDKINKALQNAKQHIFTYRLKKLPREIMNLGELKTVAEVVKIFKKTATAKKGHHLGLAPAYCDLLKTTVAEFEFEKEELEGLIKESNYVYQGLFSPDQDNNQYFHLQHLASEDYDNIFVVDPYGNDFVTNVLAYYRGKSRDSFVAKFEHKSNATAQEAAKDGIGLKFEVQTKEDIQKLIPILVGYLQQNFSASNFLLENVNLLEPAEVRELQKKSVVNCVVNLENQITEKEQESDFDPEEKEYLLLKRQLEKFQEHPEQAIPIDDDINLYSNFNFQAFKIMNGTITVPKDGQDGNMLVERGFEVQIVLVDNKNESGMSNHYVYEAAKKLSIETRATGSFGQKYLDLICEEASKKSGLSALKIEKYLQDNFIKKVVINNRPSKIVRYVVTKTAQRLMKIGHLPGVGFNGKKK